MEKKKQIADYAMIGDGRTAALIDRRGTLEWLCWPRFDSNACFAALLGNRSHGHWTIAPDGDFRTSRRYRPETMILETKFETDAGAATLTDFMPVDGTQPSLVRLLRCERGRLAFHATFSPAFGNGRTKAEFDRGNSTIIARAGGDRITLAASKPDFLAPECRFELTGGEDVAFVLDPWSPDAAANAAESLRQVESYWRRWCSQCTYQGPWRDTVLRSLLTLKALIYRPTGGIIAAPTSSLPELCGGSRNWDYRFCWIRDSTFTVLALLQAGFHEEAKAWVEWLLHAIAPDKRSTQPVYGIKGNAELPEYVADWLPGFRDSKPVRFGNAAFGQFQLDIYGEIQDTIHQWRLATGDTASSPWKMQLEMLRHLESLWQQPDAGFWEQRSAPEYFTQSRALAWVAFDRAAQATGQFGLDGPRERWASLRKQIHEEVCRRGYSERLGSFTRSYGSETFDASTLLLPLVGFLPPDDPRIIGTIDGIGRHLMRDGFVYRYDQSREDDGIRENEGTFLPCCFWYADCLILQKRTDKAAELFEKYLSTCNDVGLFAEEFDVSAKTLLGNFPQALTHLAVVHTALNLSGAGPAHTRSNSSTDGGS